MIVGAPAKKTFVSFDGGVRIESLEAKPADLSLKGLSELEEKVLVGGRHRIARGAGLSYAAASFGQDCISVDLASFNQILAYEADKSLIEVQAGATMGEIYNYLIDRGAYLAVQPGYPTITTGGCIAVDAHGKNQYRDGNFLQQVESLKLLHPAYGLVEASERFNKEVFDLTLGGYGLTGHILSAKLKTRLLPGAMMQISKEPIESIEDTPVFLAKAARSFDSTVSWHDLSGEGKNFGRGFLINSRFVEGSARPVKIKTGPHGYVDSENRSEWRLPFYSLPFTRFINLMYGGLNQRSAQSGLTAAHECFYPARRMRDAYFKLFGPAGFHESQMLVPVENFVSYVEALRAWLGQNELPVTMASAKFFGGQQKLLRFSGPGICFALNFPRSAAGGRFLTFLDKMATEIGLLPYIAKDSRLPLETVKATYDQYHSFKERLLKFDQERLFASELSERLGL